MDRCVSLTPWPVSTRTPTRIGDGNTSSLPAIGPLTRAPAKLAAATLTPAPSTRPLSRPSDRQESACGSVRIRSDTASPLIFCNGVRTFAPSRPCGHTDISTIMIYTHVLQ
jgi:hypothetical protein